MINYTEKIPNNVDLGRDRVLQRALEHWQPAYMGWWYDMGPNESHNCEVYLRTARRKARSQFRHSQRAAGLARSSWRVPLDFAPRDRYPGRHRTSIGRTAAHARGFLPLDVRSAKHFSGQCRRRPPPLGYGVFVAPLLRPRWPRRSRIASRAALR